VEEDGSITILGTISDNGDMGDIDVSISEGSGTITVNEDGTFTVSGGTPDEQGAISITVTDADGNTTTYTIFV
jgi:hypothetical protein